MMVLVHSVLSYVQFEEEKVSISKLTHLEISHKSMKGKWMPTLILSWASVMKNPYSATSLWISEPVQSSGRFVHRLIIKSVAFDFVDACFDLYATGAQSRLLIESLLVETILTFNDLNRILNYSLLLVGSLDVHVNFEQYARVTWGRMWFWALVLYKGKVS